MNAQEIKALVDKMMHDMQNHVEPIQYVFGCKNPPGAEKKKVFGLYKHKFFGLDGIDS